MHHRRECAAAWTTNAAATTDHGRGVQQQTTNTALAHTYDETSCVIRTVNDNTWNEEDDILLATRFRDKTLLLLLLSPIIINIIL